MSVGSIIEAQVRATGTKAASAELIGFGRTASAVGKQVDKGLGASLARGLTKTGAAADTAGRVITKSLGLPLAAAGAVAVKMALDFDTAFARIGALAGKLGVSVDDAKKHILALAGETAQSPQDLANALYFVASAGLKASQVMPVLDAAAKAAAAGMGDAATIAQTLTSVVNAYAGTGLTAAKATNIMTEAVKVGKAEATDFATGLGPVIGVAAQAGVSFNDLAAAIAQATNLGLPFDRAVTAARFVISSLESPTAKAKNALHDYGFEVAQIHEQLAKPGGLQHVLQTLADTFDLSTAKGREAWAAVTGGARGAVLAVDLVGKHTEATNGILQKLDESAQAGAHTFDTAYAKATNTTAFRTEQLGRKLQATAITLGEKLLPFVDKAAQFVTKLADKFGDLTDKQQENVLKWAGIAIAAGPVLRVFGGVLRIGGGVVGTLTRIGNAALGAASGLKAANAAAAASTATGGAVAGGLASLGVGALVAGGAAVAAGFIKNAADAFHYSSTQIVKDSKLTASQVDTLENQLTSFAGGLNLLHNTYGRVHDAADIYNKVLADAIKLGIPASRATAILGNAFAGAAEQLGGFGGGLDDYRKALEDALGITRTGDKVVKLSAAGYYSQAVSIATAAGAFGELTTIMAGGEKLSNANTLTIAKQISRLHHLDGALTANQQKWLNAYLRVGDYKDALDYLKNIVDRTSDKFDKHNRKIEKNSAVVHTAAGDYDKLTGAIKRVPTDVNTKVNLKGLRESYAAAGDWLSYLRSFPTTIETTFRVKGTNILQKQAGGVVPGMGSGDIVPAMLEPGELVVPKSVVKRFGAERLQTSLGMVHAMKDGGVVAAPAGVQFRDLVVTQAKATSAEIIRDLDWEARKMAHR